MLDPDGTERQVPASSLRPGDMFVVRPGETIAADGEVLFGQSAVDRSMMTGESVPGDAAVGDSVTGGTVALTGRLVVRADKTGKDTQLSQLIRLVEQAQAQKAAIQRAADRICGVFVPGVLACAALTLAGWLLAGAAAGHAFSAGLAVLIIACPCALGLATPAALVAACGRGARLGIFIKGYQRPGNIPVGHGGGAGQDRDRHHRPDDAGGRPAPPTGVTRAELLRYAGAVEQASEHAVAAAISAAAASEAGPLPPAERFRALPGLGARGTVDGREVVVGRAALLAEPGHDRAGRPRRAAARSWEQAGCTAVLVGWDGAVQGGCRRHRHDQAVRGAPPSPGCAGSGCTRSC